MADVRGRFSRFRRSLHPLSDLHPLLARLDGSHARVRCLVASFGTTSGHYPVGLWHRRRWLGLCDVGCAHYRNVPSQAASSAVWRGSRMVLATPSSLPVRCAVRRDPCDGRRWHRMNCDAPLGRTWEVFRTTWHAMNVS